MYNFIKGQWIMGKITEEKVLSYVPRYITQEQAEEILATPQDGVLTAPKQEEV
jgi:hypothetical protein